MKQTITDFLIRELNKLREEVSLYSDPQNLWVVEGNIHNSGGNLCLHILGNLNHFIGATLGNTGFVRLRDLEFTDKNIPREKLIHEIDDTIYMIKNVLSILPEERLLQTYPLEKHGQQVTTGHMIIHLLSHLNYHLGQVNYHRRLLDR
jgi:uncharacterized damage-inducible protein DinB